MKQNFFAVDLGTTSGRTILGTKELQDYDVTMWEKHGVFAVDCDAMQAFDQIDVLNKSALIYIAAKNMGFEPDGMSREQMKEMTVAFNLPK